MSEDSLPRLLTREDPVSVDQVDALLDERVTIRQASALCDGEVVRQGTIVRACEPRGFTYPDRSLGSWWLHSRGGAERAAHMFGFRAYRKRRTVGIFVHSLLDLKKGWE